MIDLIVKHGIALLYLIAGSISDLKTREVADWANYGLIALGIVANLILSLFFGNPSYILTSLFGFAVFLILSLILFYTGQWGGGDSKMLMGLGALYGLGFNWQDSSFLISFLVNTLLAGAIYGIFWSALLSFKNRKKFMQQYKKISATKHIKFSKAVSLILLLCSLIIFFLFKENVIRFLSVSLGIVIVFTLYLWIFIKSVENSCMFKYVTPDKLTEGDWIARDIKIGGKYITGPKDLGISKKQIQALKTLYKQNKVKKVLIKEGIPFVPSFLLGWIFTLVSGNILEAIL
jgi:Flp pilus assembly protein protease CpaA